MYVLETHVCPYLCWEIVIFMHWLRHVYVYAWVETHVCLCLGKDMGMSMLIIKYGFVVDEIKT